MKTEILNEYIFARIVADQAQKVRRARQHKMEDEGIEESEIINTPITLEDLRLAIDNVEWYRSESLKLLKEFQSNAE